LKSNENNIAWGAGDIIQALNIFSGKEAQQLAGFFVLAPNKATRGHR